MKYFVWEYETFFGSTKAIICQFENGKTFGIPEDELNTDYLEYVRWLFDGNTPEQWQPPTESVVE